MRKTKVIFVGSFAQSKDGSVGGQMFACQSLISSRISDRIEWMLIDSTAKSNIMASVFHRSWRAFLRLIKFCKALLSGGADAALIFTAHGSSFVEKGTMALLAKLFGKTVILAPRSGLMNLSYEQSRFLHRFIPYVIRKVDYVICQGANWKTFFQEISGEADDKFVVIQNWLHTEPYFAIERPTSLKKDTINILFLAWLIAEKGIFDLIESARNIAAQHPQVQFWICGEGEHSQEARAKVDEYGIAHAFDFKGWVKGERKMDMLRNADIYVLPSYFEGFPNSLMEAMASQLPVISTTVGAIPELVHTPSNGLLYEAGDVEGLTEHLQTFITQSEYRNEAAQNARQTIRENNTIEIALQKFDDLFEKIEHETKNVKQKT